MRFSHRSIRKLKRYERFFVTAGFLIVILTFVVRDVLLESARTMAESISAAETSYLLENAAIELYHEVDQVDGHVMEGNSEVLNHLSSQRPKIQFSADPESILDRESVQHLRMESEQSEEFYNLGRLLRELPFERAQQTELDEFYRRWDADRLSLLRPIAPIGEKIDPAKEKADAAQDKRTYADMWLIRERLQTLRASILDNAERTLEKKEYIVAVYTPISVLLYVIGTLLAVLARLAGVEPLES